MTRLREGLALPALLLLACTTSRPMPDAASTPLPPPDAAKLLTQGPQVFADACAKDFEAARAQRQVLLALDPAKQPQELLQTYDRLFAHVQLAGSRASVARNAHPDPALREVADACEQEAQRISIELSLDRGLYDALSAVDLSQVDTTTRHWVERSLQELRRAGVDRDEATRQKITALNDELTRISQDFGANIRKDVRHVELDPAQLAGLPEDYRQSHPVGPNGKVRINTDYPDYVPFMTYAKDAKAREALWRAYRRRGHPENGPVLQQLVERRQELAKLLGSPHWAAYITEIGRASCRERVL